MSITARWLLNVLSVVATFPCALTCWFEQWVSDHREGVFVFWAQLLALVPGLPGVYIRRGFYRQTLAACSRDVFIGFGTCFTHRTARVERGVYIGSYALLGSAILRKDCMIGSRASLLSGGALHPMDEHGNWLPTDRTRMQTIEIGENAWLGEGVIAMCDVGARAMVAAGAVVSAPVPERVMVGGNPARFIRKLSPAAQQADRQPNGQIPSVPAQLGQELEV